MSKQLQVKSKPSSIAPYFSKPKGVSEKFVNKKLEENYTQVFFPQSLSL